jgi:endonuclease/exonuclease/phosphatase family metal-dependent hydrolase
MNRTIERSLINITPDNRFLLAGNFNAHHPMENTNKQPLQAEALITYLERNNVTLHNEPDTPTYISRSENSSSEIDLVLSSHSISHNIINWAINQENRTGSDHLSVKFDIISDQFETVPSPVCQKYNSKWID